MIALALELGGKIPTPPEEDNHQDDESEDVRYSEDYPDEDTRTALD
jgi:hypothetical protein